MTDKDLFDDSTMSFGEHLEALRYHLIMALIGFTVAMILMLFCSKPVMRIVTTPVESATLNSIIKQYGTPEQIKQAQEQNPVLRTWRHYGNRTGLPTDILKKVEDSAAGSAVDSGVKITINVVELARALHDVLPEIPLPPPNAPPRDFTVNLPRDQFAGITGNQSLSDRVLGKPITLSVEEGFMIYMKVAMITGFVLSSPWVFYQLWLFVAAGLYPHEKKYIYIYLPFSIGLFLTGAVFCFLVVLPYVLDFLFDFTTWLELNPQIRLNEWLGFALIMPVMFGLSFELPLIMLFLERISIFKAQDYVEKRRIAILVIAFLSMVLTPSDPVSMLLMLIPLCALYELGIILCRMQTPHPVLED